MQKYLYILLLLFSPATLYAQYDTTRHVIQGGWIEKMGNNLNVKLAAKNDIETFSVDTKQAKIELHPNAALTSRVYFTYRNISLYISYVPKFIPGNDDDDIKGKTRSRGLGLDYNVGRFYNELYYSYTKGYYLKNTSDYNPGWHPGDPYIQIPQLAVNSIEGSTGYNFNQRFSLYSLTSQTERQLKSAGSFIPRLYYRYFIIDDKSTGTTQKTNNYKFVLGAGYFYNFVLNSKLYFSLGATPAAGYIFTRLLTRYPDGYQVNRSASPLVQLSGKAEIGYNSRRFFAGGYITASTTHYRQANTVAVNTFNTAYYQLFMGYRFGAPSLLKKAYGLVFKN